MFPESWGAGAVMRMRIRSVFCLFCHLSVHPSKQPPTFYFQYISAQQAFIFSVLRFFLNVWDRSPPPPPPWVYSFNTSFRVALLPVDSWICWLKMSWFHLKWGHFYHMCFQLSARSFSARMRPTVSQHPSSLLKRKWRAALLSLKTLLLLLLFSSPLQCFFFAFCLQRSHELCLLQSSRDGPWLCRVGLPESMCWWAFVLFSPFLSAIASMPFSSQTLLTVGPVCLLRSLLNFHRFALCIHMDMFYWPIFHFTDFILH